MRILLDTHALLWALADVGRLSKPTSALLRDTSNEVFFSAASVWEIAIKRNLGKLRVPEQLPRIAAERAFTGLPISMVHAEEAGALPLHHRDPFDRMLIAQARVESLTLLTDDSRVAGYDVRCMRAS